MSILKGKNILITGGTGSIGTNIIKELLAFHKPKQIRIFSRDDTKQFDLMQQLPKDAPVNFLIGDIRDKNRLMMAMEDIDIVFHAAAMKHVSLCERNPFEAMNTNINGTQNVIECALSAGVDRVVYVSTDKAANPTNIMGTTKLMAERLMLTSYFYKGKKKTKFCCVRFGNVLWSRGSVLPLFLKQIYEGGPVTLTDPLMTRFFMSLRQAASLVIKAAEITKENEIFVLKMPAVRMGDVVDVIQEIMVEEKLIKKTVPIVIIGPKEGERTHEKLLTQEESENALETEKLFIIKPNSNIIPFKKSNILHYDGAKKAKVGEYNTTTTTLLNKKELKKLIKEGEFYKNFKK
ncbi:MAG: polysaccharide biosynthesis protein [Candidatus Nomurabacteria bacterium]|nr:polysaccharide biosynthesis protein [Candidatus Nomurabacteria bacterium]